MRSLLSLLILLCPFMAFTTNSAAHSTNKLIKHDLPAGESKALMQGIDLELTASTPNADPALWVPTEVNYVLTNTGDIEASNVVVQVDAFPNGFVYFGGQEYTISQGSYQPYVFR